MDYSRIKELAKAAGCKVNDLMALAPQNDPFYIGTNGQKKLAEWFAGLWERFGCGSGFHIRRIHYRMISQEKPIRLPNGLLYENTRNCDAALGNAAKYARYLGLVPLGDFTDKRNKAPVDYVRQREEEPGIWVTGGDSAEYTFPSFPAVPGYGVSGFEGQQRYHLELWCEKSTMNDVLDPICQKHGAVLVTGVGELSITHVRWMVDRLEKYRRPCRVFYVSDFDPAGESMPVAVARKIEFLLHGLDDGFDVRLFPLVLTREQCEAYRLPRTPIKETELRKEGFEERHGAGATELDALEALHPGELARIVGGAMGRYFDADLDRRVEYSRDSLHEYLSGIESDVLAPYRDRIDRLRQEHERIKAAFENKTATLRERTRKLWEKIEADLEDHTPAIDADDIPVAAEAEEVGDGLFNTDRDYMGQLAAYKRFQGK